MYTLPPVFRCRIEGLKMIQMMVTEGQKKSGPRGSLFFV